MATRDGRLPWQIAALGAALMAGSPLLCQQSVDDILKKGIVLPGRKPADAAPQPSEPVRPAPAPRKAPMPAASEGSRAAAPAPRGFRMDLPPGWKAQLGNNGTVVAAGQGDLAVVIAPVLEAGEAAGPWLQRSGVSALAQYFRNPRITGIYQSRTGTGAALASFDFADGNGAANALCLVNGGIGTLYVIAGPKAGFAQQRPALVRILKSFSFSGETAGPGEPVPPERTTFTRFQDPYEGAFSQDVPAGWKAEGGMVRKASVDTRGFLWVTSPDGASVVRLGDPSFGEFKTPNQLDASVGLREGMPYSPGYGFAMVISRYIPGPQFAQQYVAKLAGDLGLSNVQLKAVNPRQDLNGSEVNGIMQQQTTGGEAEFTCTRSGRPCAGKVVAATTALVSATMPDTAQWHYSFLTSYVTTPERAGATEQIVQHMVESLEINPQWAQMQSQTANNTGQIARGAAQYTARVFDEVHQNRARSEERVHQNRIDSIRGVVRLRDPGTGEELEGVAGRNYYYRVSGGGTVGTDQAIRDPDFTELEQIR